MLLVAETHEVINRNCLSEVAVQDEMLRSGLTDP
jgi:hypothetical protein